MARRDRLDVALFQHRGVGELGAGGVWVGEAFVAALSRAGAAVAGYAAAGCGEGAEFEWNALRPARKPGERSD
jgi:hypothetical protein